jgi:ketosteroid isomerase-like protein
VFDDVAIKATWFTLHAQELAAICFSTPEVIMRILLIFVSALMCSCCCSAQKKGSTNSCPSDEQTIRTIEHERWQAATPRHDVATTDRLLAKDFFYSDDTGAVMSRNQLLQMYKTPQVSRNDVEPAQDIRVVVQGDIALMNFTLLWSVTQSGISWSQTSRFTEVFGCREGQWKILAMHETLVPNATRAPSQPADTTLDEFVGKYVISQKGEKLEIKITRRGHGLFERWGEDKVDEILPGKHDTFFARGESIMELFLRNKNGKVTGILYTMPDGELEATRLADVSATP